MASAPIQFRPRTAAASGVPAGGRSGFLVEGMTCSHCAQTVQRALQAVAGVTDVQVELATGRVQVVWRGAAPVRPEAIVSAAAQAGYRATALTAAAAQAAPPASAETAWKRAVWLGGPVTIVLIVAEWFLGLGMNRAFRWVGFSLALPVQILVGAGFYCGAWRQLRARQANMDTLVALGSTAAFGFSVGALFTGLPGHLYFMESSAILTLVSLGHWLEARMSAKAGESLKSLLNLAPARARTLSDGRETEVPVASLLTGDVIVLKPGDRVPVDAVVTDGASAVDEAMLTGEPLPVEKTPGTQLFTGTVNQSGQLLARVTATGEATALAHIIAAVQRAQSSRADIQRLADKISSTFVPVVIAVALAAALGWGLAYNSVKGLHEALALRLWHVHLPESPGAAAFVIFAGVLIVACPCAMGLATPAALMAGVNAAARRGILIRDAQALEKSGGITTLVFDKTGTLTEGRPAVVASDDFRAATERVVPLGALAAALARPSQHPLSRALAAAVAASAVGAPPVLRDWREHRGLGLEAALGGAGTAPRQRLGSAGWLRELGVDLAPAQTFAEQWAARGATVLFLAEDSRLAGVFALRDPLKANAPTVLRALAAAGFRLRLLTGDQRGSALAVAAELGLPAAAVTAEVRPERKAGIIRELQAAGERVAFIGDGLNDGPALAQADLGIAVSGATDVAREAADIVLLRADLAAIPVALDLAQATRRVIRQNLFWAFFYNAAAIPLAALGFLSPVVCALAMGLSDVVVIGNALRLRRR